MCVNFTGKTIIYVSLCHSAVSWTAAACVCSSSELVMSLRWTFSRCCCWCRCQFVSCSLRLGSPARITGPFLPLLGTICCLRLSADTRRQLEPRHYAVVVLGAGHQGELFGELLSHLLLLHLHHQLRMSTSPAAKFCDDKMKLKHVSVLITLHDANN